MKLHDAVEAWLAYRAQLVDLFRLEQSTHATTGRVALLWQDQLGDIELAALRKSHIELALGRLSKTRGAATLVQDRAVLSQVLNWCVDEQLLDTKPRMPTVSLPSIELELPSDQDFIAAIKAVPPQHEASLRFMMLTGLAPHECERLQPEDFDKRRSAIAIGMREGFKVKCASRRRWVPLNDEARRLFAHAPFPSCASTEKALQRARGHMPKSAHAITPKMMRKWFSSKLSHDCAEHVLQRLLGHAPGSRITRQHYVRSNQADIERAVSSLATPQESACD